MESKEKLFVELINKMLKPHGVDYNFVLANPYINGEGWFMHYKWTQQESDNFKAWAKKRIMKVFRCGAHYAQKELSWFMLAYGLCTIDEK